MENKNKNEIGDPDLNDEIDYDIVVPEGPPQIVKTDSE
jgi:hypothetical protein